MPRRLYFYSTLIVLFFSISASLSAFGEEEDDIFGKTLERIHSESLTRSKLKKIPAKTETQGTVCITCQQGQTKTQNQRDLEALNASTTKQPRKNAKEPDCITCDRVTVGAKGKIIINSPAENLWAQYADIHAYSTSMKTQKMIKAAIDDSYWVLDKNTRRRLRQRAPTPATGNCLRHVKLALQQSDLATEYLGGSRVNRPPRDAINRLKKVGFKNLLEIPPHDKTISNPAIAPKGAILIYAGGYNGGHIEIKTDWGTKGTYVSDHQAPTSIMQNELGGRAGNGYKLIGVMVKPGG